MQALRSRARAAGRRLALGAAAAPAGAPFLAESRRYAAAESSLLGLAAAGGVVTSGRAAPLLDGVAAARAAGLSGAPELVHLDFLVVEFRVDHRFYGERQDGLFAAYEVASGAEAPWLPELLREPAPLQASWAPRPGPLPDPERLRALLARAEDAAVERARQGLDAVETELAAERERRRGLLDGYYEETARECEEERKAIYFRLYYFDREEKLKRRLEDARRRLSRLQDEEQAQFAASAKVALEGVALLSLPLWRFEGPGGSTLVDALGGRSCRG